MIPSSPISLVAFSVLSALTIVGVVWLAQTYNRLVGLKNVTQNGFAQIEIQLKRRYDLIPNLVECVKSYMAHERETLQSVIAARNHASTELAAVRREVSNLQNMQGLVNAENALNGALGRMNFVMERYPDLKANLVVSQLSEELASTENRITFARQVYNDSATTFNIHRQCFPTVLVAGSLGFTDDLTMLEFEESQTLQAAPQVAFA